MNANTITAPAVTVAYFIRAFFRTLQDEAEGSRTPLTELIVGGEDTGELELMERIAGYADIVEQVWRMRFPNQQTEFAGIWEYEITEPFGGVVARCVLSTGNLPDDAWAIKKLDELVDNSGGLVKKLPEPCYIPPPQRFVVQVQPTASTHGFNRSRVSDIGEADDWSIYTGRPGNFTWVADFALTQKDVALHFAADLAVRLGYGMDRSAVDVVEANEERDLSQEEGWGMFEVDGRWMLQRFEDIFDSDADALMWVAKRASAGSARHLVALRKIGSLA